MAMDSWGDNAVVSSIPPLHHLPRSLHPEARDGRPSQAELEYSL